jgi:hypothetical protein
MTNLYNLQETLTILLLDELVKERDYISCEKSNAKGKFEKGGWKTGHAVSWPDEFNNYFEDTDFDTIGEIKGINDLRDHHEAIAESLLIEFYRQQLYIFNFYIDNFENCLTRKLYDDLTPIFGATLPNHPLLEKGTEDDQDELHDWLCFISENKEAKQVDELISEYILEIRTGFSDGQQFEMDQIWLNKVR